MPIYRLDNKTYDIPDDVVNDFEKDNPDATVAYRDGSSGKVYDIPLKKRWDFMKAFPKAMPYQGDEDTQQDGYPYKLDMFKPKTVDMYGAHDKEKKEMDLMKEGRSYELRHMRVMGIIGEQLDERIKANDEALKKAYGKRKEPIFGGSGIGIGRAYSASSLAVGDSDEIRNLKAEQEYLTNAKKVYEAAKNDAGFFQGMKDAVDSSYLTFGMSDLQNAERISNVQRKLEAGQELSESEHSLLTSLGLHQMVNDRYNDMLGSWYKAGMTTADMVPFMAEMAVNPLSGLGRAAMKASVKKFGQQGARAIASKILFRTIGDVTGASGMAATTGLPGVMANAMERQRGRVAYGIEGGSVNGTGFEGGDSASDAWRKAFTARTIENWSEMVGEYFSPVGKVVGKGVKKGLGKIGLSKVTDFIDGVQSSNWAKLLDDFSKQTQWNGSLGEFAEEQVGMIANALLVGDTKWSDLANAEKQLDVALGVGVFGTVMSLLRIGGYRTPKYRAKKAVERADNAGMETFGSEKWAVVKGRIDNAESDEQMLADLSGVFGSNATEEQKKAAFAYANALKAQQAVNTVKEKQKIDEPENPEVKLEESVETEAMKKDAAASEGAAVYAEHEPRKMREAVLRAEVARDRLIAEGLDNATYERLVNGDEADRAEILSGMTDAMREKAEDFLTQADKAEGMDKALDEAHAEEVRAVSSKVQEMGMMGVIYTVPLAQDNTGVKQWGVVLSGLDGSGQFVNGDRTVMVAPLAAVNGMPDFNSYGNIPATARKLDAGVELVPVEKTNAMISMLGNYSADVAILEQTPVELGAVYSVMGTDGKLANVTVQQQQPDGKWVVLPEGSEKTVALSDEELSRMRIDAEKAGIYAEYAQMDAEHAAQRAKEKQDSVASAPKKVLPDGRVAVFNVEDEGTVAYDVFDASGNVVDSNEMASSDFYALEDYVPEAEEELTDEGLPLSPEAGQPATQPTETGEESLPREKSGADALTMERLASTLPKTKKGEIDYEAMTPQQRYQYTSLSESPEVALEDLRADISAGEEELAKVQELFAEAKGGKRVELRDKVRKLTSANEELKKLYESVKPEESEGTALDTSRKKKEKKRSEQDATRLHQSIFGEENGELVSPQSASLSDNKVSEQIVQPQEKAKKSAKKVQPVSEEEQPMSAIEFVAYQFSKGNIRLQRQSLAKELGYGNEELNKFMKLWAKPENGGLTVERAGELLMQMDSEGGTNFFDQSDTNAGRDAILELFGMARTWGDISNLIKDNRELEKQRQSEYERNAYENYIYQTFGKTVEDYEAEKEYDEQNYRYQGVDLSELDAIFAEAEFERQRLIEQEYDKGRNAERNQEQSGVLSEKQTDNNGGSQQEESGRPEEAGIEPVHDGEAAQAGASGSEVKYDNQGNPIDGQGKLIVESVSSIDEITDEDFMAPTRSIAIPNVPQNVADAIGSEGKPVVIKKNIFEKNKKSHKDLTPVDGRKILTETLFSPNLYGQNQKATRPYNWILIHLADKHSAVIVEVNQGKDFVEIVNWHYLNDATLEQKKNQAIREGGLILTFENAAGNTSDSLASVDKGSNLSEENKGNGENIEVQLEKEREKVETSPTEAQKKAGNYRMGHVKIDGYDITIENPKGSVRSGKDANGTAWSVTMNNDYGYIRGTEAVDGDHIDVFLSDNPTGGRVFVVDQTSEDGSFDESKVMYGFNSLDEARDAYLSNYDAGWESRIMAITEVSKDEFKKWIDSSHRKTKAFSEYKGVKSEKRSASRDFQDEARKKEIKSRLEEIEARIKEIGKQKKQEYIGTMDLAQLLIEEKRLELERLDLNDEYKKIVEKGTNTTDEPGASIEATNVARMKDIETRLTEIEDRRIEILDELEADNADELAVGELESELYYLGQEQGELEAEYSGLRAMNDESNAMLEAEGSDVRFRFIGERGAANLDKAEEATTRLDNLKVAREMEAEFEAKKARIEKLKASEPVEITGEEIPASEDLKEYKKNALEYGKSLQGEYTNKDTGVVIQLQRGRKNGGLKEVLSHDVYDVAHIKSVAAIPQIIENSI